MCAFEQQCIEAAFTLADWPLSGTVTGLDPEEHS
jgi:hypothetical protein